MKPYYFHTKNTNISYPETINNLAKNPRDKLANKEILTLLDYLELEKACQQR